MRTIAASRRPGRLGTAINAWRPGPPFAAKMAHPAAAVNIELDGKRTYVLFFDRKTHLLTSAQFKVLDPEAPDRVELECVQRFLDHKEVNGVMRPMKGERYIDGLKVSEYVTQEIRTLDKIPAAIFKMP